MDRRLVLVFHAVVLITIAGVVAAQEHNRAESRVDVQQLAELHRSAQSASAERAELILPYFSVQQQDIALVLTSSVNEPVEVSLRAKFPDGRVLPLGEYVVPRSRHWSLDLRTAIHGYDPSFRRGSLWVSYLGTPETIQGWVVAQEGRHTTEFTLTASSKVTSRYYLSFWGESLSSRPERRTLHLLNASASPVRYSIERADSRRRGAPVPPREIEPNQQHKIELGASSGSGWVKIEHDGEPGALLGQVTVESRQQMGKVPLWTLPSGYGTDFEALRVEAGNGSKTSLAIWNSRDEPQEVTIHLRDWISGSSFWRDTLTLPANGIGEASLTAALASVPDDRTFRIQVSAEKSGALVHGVSETAAGELKDLSFIDHRYVHASGSYPILPVDQFDTDLSLLNLGPDSAEIVAQVYWDEGTYAFGPFVIDPAASFTLSIKDLIAQGPEDLLGRTLPIDLRQGFLKWRVHSGSRGFLGRTEATPKGSGDRIGFNCLGCCWEAPWGGIIPSYVDFFADQSAAFTSVVQYDTCNGSMGPYQQTPGSMTVPSPFNWDGQAVSTSSAAEATISFSDWGEQVSSDCTVTPAFFGGSGVADACKILLRKSHNPSQSWSTSQACTTQASSEPQQKCARCNSCCSAQKSYWTCKKKAAHIINSEYNACIGLCAIDHC